MEKAALALCVSCGLVMSGSGLVMAQTTAPTPSKTAWKFAFGTKKLGQTDINVAPTTLYTAEQGYGYEPGGNVSTGESATIADKPFLFSTAVPEGNYRVTVTLGDKTADSNATIKAETRRLMLENIQTPKGKTSTHTFLVNVRTPRLPDGSSVRLKPGEIGPPLSPRWDDKLTLEFNGTRPAVSSVEIAQVEDATTIFLAGDSTVTDQGGEPWAAWGQMLPRFLKPTVAVANYAESGLTLGSFRGQKRLEKLLSVMKPGDYTFIQFGHNDQKDKGENAGPYTSYKSNLKDYITKIRAKGGIPVLVTPMERRRWTDGKPTSTLTDFAEAVRQAGQEEQAPVIDLNVESVKLYAALGDSGSKKAFVFYPMGSYPGQKEELKDNTHFSNYGAYELARLIVNGIKEKVPALAPQLAADAVAFDPATPDAFDKFTLPPSPYRVVEKPAGS